MQEKTYTKKRIDAFQYAFSGLREGIKREHHLKLHFISAIAVIAMGIQLQISKGEWLAVFICCGLVIAAELFNTAIEKICDLISKEKMPEIKYIKDVSAAAVLILSFTSLSVALFILTQHFQL